jgi:signal transduction histidine kinase
MKITSKLKAEIKAFLEDYWNSYFQGEMKTYASYLTDDYKTIGGTEQEVFNNKQEMMDYTLAVVNQWVGNVEPRNKKLQIFPLDPYFMAHEFTDIYINVDKKWVFYGKFRLSSIIQKINSHWKVLHQHGSYPDSKTEAGEAHAFDKIGKENRDLRDAVKRRTIELENKTHELEIAIESLKATQTQLIHSEKMASLGELTAGIAHEIQNPLNFVNNFSEVSSELVEEMEEEVEDGNLEDVKEITADLKQNLEKINHHGQRASSIVKSMLEHSRTGDGNKEPTDINKLADEYLRLSYHGLRAKDKSFNADFTTKFDESLPKVNVVPQDIGRVLLNLINNAFQAVSSNALAQGDNNYKPTVTVGTKKVDDKIGIIIKDNGSGIPDDIKDKIFQPFFTTKPTGQGTGLGLSMSYDIITKGHGGSLDVETMENSGTNFIIMLPLL